MWHFKIPVSQRRPTSMSRRMKTATSRCARRDYISIATTRPETMLGDGVVAVHPSDERYAPIVGKLCEIPVGPKRTSPRSRSSLTNTPDPSFGLGRGQDHRRA
ncbi:MAG: hypothetical protein R3D84_09535 [Paracoccaceae bacterium]